MSASILGPPRSLFWWDKKTAMGACTSSGEACPCRGLKRGVVVDIAQTAHAIKTAIEAAEAMAQMSIRSACVGIAGSHIKSLNSHGIVAIKHQEVTRSDITRVIEAARAVAIPTDQQIIHILPQQFSIDGQDGIQEPLGMSGVRLEANVHIVTGGVSAAQNLIKCVEQQDLIVTDVVLEQIASSYAVLNEDEQSLGVCLIDIGGGTTDIAVLIQGAVHHSAVIPMAGDQVTNDLAIALHTSTAHAEALNTSHASVGLEGLKGQVQVPNVHAGGEQTVGLDKVQAIVEARYEEIFAYVWSELKRHGLHEAIPAGIVLTGGGAKITGCATLAERVFAHPIRIAKPMLAQAHGFDPTDSTAVGLLLYSADQQAQESNASALGKGWWHQLKQWAKVNL